MSHPSAWPRPALVSPARLSFTAQMLKQLTAAPVADALGVALSFLLHCVYNHPELIRRVMNEPVIKQGFTGSTLLAELNRVARA